MSKKREGGFYRVNYGGRWVIAEYRIGIGWHQEDWMMCGSDLSFSDGDFDDIDEERIEV